MFDIGWSELLVIAIVAIVVVGPEDLPPLMRTVGRYAGKLRRMADDFQSQFNDALSESEFKDLQDSINASVMEPRHPLGEPVMLPKPESQANVAESKPATRTTAHEPARTTARKSAAKSKSGKPRATRKPKTANTAKTAAKGNAAAKTVAKTSVKRAPAKPRPTATSKVAKPRPTRKPRAVEPRAAKPDTPPKDGGAA